MRLAALSDIHTPRLQIDKGVIFEGHFFMEGATKPQPAPAPPPKRAPTPVK